MHQEGKQYTIQKAADTAGTTIKALRYYEKIGLLIPSGRTEAGYRLYSEDDLKKLKTILIYKMLEFPLKDIAHMMEGNSPDRERTIEEHVELLEDMSFRYQALAELAKVTFPQANEPHKVTHASDGTAMVILSMQHDLVQWLGDPAAIDRISKNIARVADAMRKRGSPVIYVSDCHNEDEISEFELWGKHAIVGTPGAQILPQLAPHAEDYLLYKRSYSAFEGTDLHKLLERLNISRLIVSGLLTNIGMHHTCADAFRYGYQMTVPEDCTATVNNDDFRFSIKQLQDSFGIRAVPTDQLVEQLLPPPEP